MKYIRKSAGRIASRYTVVKWGHTEGIEREKTSSEKYTVISLDFWRDKLFLVFQIWGQNTFGGQFLEHCHLIWNCPWFLKRFLIFQIWGQYLAAKSKCKMPSDFWWKRQGPVFSALKSTVVQYFSNHFTWNLTVEIHDCLFSCLQNYCYSTFSLFTVLFNVYSNF